MEVIYPRDTRKDGLDSGIIGETNIVNDNSLNQTFYEYLTKYFNDNSRSIIETVYNTYNELPNVGVNELLFAYLQRIETELKNIRDTSVQNTDRIVEKLLEIHSVVDLGEYTWNDFTEHIFMLTGGVTNSITINQFIANICAVVQVGSEFQTVDAATGLTSISLYDAEYVQKLIDSGGVLDIGGDKYVPLTSCEIQINNNDLGGQLGDDTQTEDNTSEQDAILPNGYLYPSYAFTGAVKLSSSDDWFVPSSDDFISILSAVGGLSSGGKLKSVNPDFWNNTDNGNEDLFSFNMLGSGRRNDSVGCLFVELKEYGYLWSSTPYFATAYKALKFQDVSVSCLWANLNYGYGLSIRFAKHTADVDGTFGQYVGNDGKVYKTVALGGYHIMCENLKETKLRDGSLLPNLTESVDWDTVNFPAYCVYNNEPSVIVSSGAVSGVDESGQLSVMSLTPAGELNDPKKVSELGSRHLIPVFMRKIT